ncbi:MAG: purine nucleoside permease [Sphaerochaeta sp.]
MKNGVKGLLLVFLIILSVTTLGAQAVAEKQEVKVLILDMFEVGENKGDFAGEFQYFYEAYLDGAESYQISKMPLTLYVNEEGVAGCIAGMGKAQASSSLTAILSDSRFDFSNTYILVSGCSGMSPERGTLGDVVWADELVDFELGHGWLESDMSNPDDGTFLRSEGYDRPGYIKLNKALAQWAYGLTSDVPLSDNSATAAYRANYGPTEALEKPSVRMGVSVTGDSYWHGASSSARADEVTAAYGEGTYMVTQMEDNAFGVVAMNYDLLDRLLVCRDVVNFDQPYPGQSVRESLDASSGAFSIGMKNGFAVSRVVIDEIVANWDTYKTSIPSVNY